MLDDDHLVIYAGRRVRGSGPKRPPRAKEQPQPCAVSDALPASSGPPTAERLRALIEKQASFGESINEAFQRKERELRELFASLDEQESRSLLARLANPATDDQAAAAFARLGADRRRRLLAFLDQVAHGCLARRRSAP